jgi:hypothetical protein
MNQPLNENAVSMAGNSVDPLIEQNNQLGNNDPIDPKRRPAWIVQLQDTADEATIAALRTKFGLRLTDYVPPRSYIESLSPTVAAALRAEDRVRAVSMMSGQLKLSADLRADHESNDPKDPVPVDVVIFNALADDVLAQVHGLVPEEQFIAVLDDRARGGAFVVRLLIRSGIAAQIAELDGVRWVEEVAETVDDGNPQSGTSRIPEADRLGLTGAGQTIGVIDNGPPDLDHCFFADDAGTQPGPMHRKIVQLRNGANTQAGKHATFTSGIAAGDEIGNLGAHPLRGVAFGARLACGNKRDIDATSSVLAELTAAASAGAFVHTNSWHAAPQGVGRPATYDQRSADVDVFVWKNQDHVVLGSSGNVGEEQGPPGTAKNALCVSAGKVGADADDVVGDGSPGPTADGRRKPDVTGLGCGVLSATVGTPCGTGSGGVSCSSSRATPWVAGVLALARQQLTEGRYRDGQPRAEDAFIPTGAMLRAIVINSAVAGGADDGIPGKMRGWGSVDPAAALGQAAPRALVDVHNADGLSTGQKCRVTFSLEGSNRLAVTLTWSEPPGAIGSDNCVVNDLDLRVMSPTGEVLLGNVFKSGQSVSGGIPDRINSTEIVLIDAAPPGEWVVEIVGAEVNVGDPKQGYALVVAGSLSRDVPAIADGSRKVVRTEPI